MAKPDLNWEQLNNLTAEVLGEDGPGTDRWHADGSHTQAFNAHFIEEFRARDGKLEGELGEVPMLLLTVRGAKSKQPRTVPLSYHTFGDRLVVVASMGGAARNPPWFYNVQASPDVTVELDTGETFPAQAIITQGADRDQLYAAICERMPVFSDYQARTTRTIPVVEIRRAS